MQKYLINKNTLVICPINNNKSIIYEKDNTFIIDNKSINIIKENIKYYGNTFIKSVTYSNMLFNNKYKNPLIINYYQKLIFFPTLSYKNEECIWFNYNGIYSYYYDNNILKIVLINNKEIAINLTLYIFYNQFLKTARLYSFLAQKD